MPRGVKNVTKEVKEEIKEEVVEEAVKEEIAAEPAADVVESKEVEVIDELPADDVPGDVPEEKADEEAADELEEPPVLVESSEWEHVENLRIYPRPNDLACSTVFTGNIKVVADLGDLKRIQYMKHGFGIVEALTDAL